MASKKPNRSKLKPSRVKVAKRKISRPGRGKKPDPRYPKKPTPKPPKPKPQGRPGKRELARRKAAAAAARKRRAADRTRQWLNDRLALAGAILWRAPDGVARAFPSWSAVEQRELCNAIVEIRDGSFRGMPDAPPVTLALNSNGTLFSAGLEAPLAWSYFLAYVAQSVVAEMTGETRWSLSTYTTSELSLLFDSRSLFEWLTGQQRYGILRQHNLLFSHGAVTPGDPVRTFDFLKTNGLLGATARETIERVLDWCRDNLVHYYDGSDPANFRGYWQYEGWPPVERILSATTHSIHGHKHWTAGCWGTTGFLRTVLRTANIPVALENPCGGHAMPRFVREALFLSHGDDPYSSLSKDAPRFPIGDLLIDQAKYESWFGSSVPEATRCDNVGRRPRELRGLG